MNAVSFGRLYYGHANAIDANPSIGALIAFLRGAWNPTAVFWRIWTGVVDPIKGEAFWSRSHVSKEGIKTIAPTFANDNAASAIVSIIPAFRIMTSTLHIDPTAIRRRSVHAVTAVSDAGKLTRSNPSRTPAAFRLALPQIACRHAANRAAYTLACAILATKFCRSPIAEFCLRAHGDNIPWKARHGSTNLV